ncbi:ABC transporter ATP-binding protein [Nocardioides iriomotensis]|uniref:ABC transporter ATP-binding protein n=1 Tax=Nocardioides iriomotensis TaxID=715784 RepID=UPI001F0CFEBB|nr:ABC transporter ATP-binding protein [Nocardioides iriomotensis]
MSTHHAPPATSAVHLRRLSRSYGEKTALSVDDLTIAPGEFVCLIGRSGSGKSTLLRALAGLDNDVTGSGHIEVPERRSVLFQDSRLLPWASVVDNVTLGLKGEASRVAARDSLADVGLAGRESDYPSRLSGGEQQRVALARSLVREPQLLLADEPFGALDALTRLRMHALLRRLVAEHRPTVVLVTHDVDEALSLGERVLVLEDGRVVLDRRPTPRTAQDRLDERQRLLAALGVDERNADQRLDVPA